MPCWSEPDFDPEQPLRSINAKDECLPVMLTRRLGGLALTMVSEVRACTVMSLP